MIIEEEKIEIIEEEKNNNLSELVPQSEAPSINHFLIMFSIFFGVLIGILLVIFIIFSFYNANKNTISQGIYINGVDVSGLSKEQAIQKIQKYYDENIISKDIILVHNEYETYIKSSEINLTFDISSAVNYAYSIGKTDGIIRNNYYVFNALVNGINIMPVHTLNKEALSNILDSLSSELPDKVIESSYYIEGSKLIITKGKTRKCCRFI